MITDLLVLYGLFCVAAANEAGEVQVLRKRDDVRRQLVRADRDGKKLP
eukprot:CAMPEP_0119367304 /NCGR_PEP_ID=MMETSP1334-20130426/14110_1 /TAXON_ID=127549 /ORGANISM="Calcidiscus leptoporus, Strain RCC1130" /LENGTH=47 /DNA_ID= /DNA_START= /DNA_END= /DNA_ORIENTATION=